VGFAGGTKKNPTYTSIGDHSETLQIDFDPSQTSYQKLLEVFWANHNPCSTPYSRQYMSAIFYHNDQQKKLATESRDREQARRKQKILTVIAPLTEFTLAEDYHQHYYLRQQRDLMREFNAMFPDAKAFANSTAAMRVNAYIDGYGSLDTLQKEIGSFGLSTEASKKVVETFKQRKKNTSDK
jgi:methionine-S-sulfoxide reductase